MYGIRAEIYPQGAISPAMLLDEGDIVEYRVEDRAGSGMMWGAAISKRFYLSFDPSKARTDLSGSRVQVYLTRAGEADLPFGVWFVTGARTPENGEMCELTGADALYTGFEAGFADTAGRYPSTLGDLCRVICSAALLSPLSAEPFYNDALVLNALPAWSENETLRGALAKAAFLAGCTARVGYDGQVEMKDWAGGEERVISPDAYTRFVGGGNAFCLNSLLYRREGESVFTRYAADAEGKDTFLTCVKAEANPLATEGRLNTLVRQLAGRGWEEGELTASEMPGLQAGDRAALTDQSGRTWHLLLSGVSYRYSGQGLSLRAESAVPETRGSGEKSVFGSDGSICFEAIGEVREKVMALSRAYIARMTADEIRSIGLIAQIIEAVRLHAREIDADLVQTDALTAAAAEIVNATVRRLEAGTVEADALSASIADMAALKVESLSAEDLTADRLGAALARLAVLTAGTANFDRASVKHLVSQALQLEYGVGNEVFIANLSADYAKIVRANVGNLCVRAADGVYYALNVNADGSVSAVRTGVTGEEAQAGTTAGGRTIIESEIDASELNAASIKGVRALIGKLDAARLDVDALYAREAFISHLNARDITANEYLRVALEREEDYLEELRRYLTFDAEGLTQGKADSAYTTVVSDRGFSIRRRGTVGSVGRFDQNGLTAPGVCIGSLRARRTARGGWVFDKEE